MLLDIDLHFARPHAFRELSTTTTQFMAAEHVDKIAWADRDDLNLKNNDKTTADCLAVVFTKLAVIEAEESLSKRACYFHWL